jgi:hypothetical protein
MSTTITITVAPHGNNSRGETFKVVAIEVAGPACAGGTDLDLEAFRPSTTPFLDAARRLLDQGVPENARLVMRHEHGDGVALSSRLGLRGQQDGEREHPRQARVRGLCTAGPLADPGSGAA